jgi:hypothetical protein
MYKRNLAMILSGILFLTAFGFQPAGAQGASEAKRDTGAVEKMRTKVQKIGVGGNARVEIKLRDNGQLKGYINDAGQDSFTVVDSKTGSTRTVSYADTSAVKKAGSGLSAKSLIIIGAAVVGAAITWIIIKPVLCDGGAQTRGPC